ncbi:MAG: hypothetical protein HXY20_02210 [Acidobacteria bacterium]|nr:hypothetical protein [Acidobacteriota bacterium]
MTAFETSWRRMANTCSDQSGRIPEREAAQNPTGEELAGSAVFLTGMKDLEGLDAAAVETRVIGWWEAGAGDNCRIVAEKLASLPEPFMTVAFHNRTRAFAAGLATVRSAFDRYGRNELTYSEAMFQIGVHFSREGHEGRSWIDSMNDIAALMRWQPTYERACDYVRGAVLTGDADADRLRSSLIGLMKQPHRFLESAERDRFERTFMEFKQRYANAYSRAHEETVGEVPGSTAGLSGIDRVALQNLQLLSQIAGTDRTQLTQVRLILAWRRARRCPLPARAILEQKPRCCCNFVPAAVFSVQASATELNRTVREGIEHLRAELRARRRTIIANLEAEGADENDARQVAALLSRGPVIPLRQRTIEILNAVLKKYPGRP